MKTRYSYFAALAGAFLGLNLMAQTPTTNEQIVTTGMVGLTNHETARLNVLNLNPVPVTANASASCNVELQFVDSQNNPQGSKIFYNVAPQTAALFDLVGVAGASPASVVREQIRGIVTVNPPVPVATSIVTGSCPVKVTLEVFDSASLITVALTSDTSPISEGGVTPLAAK